MKLETEMSSPPSSILILGSGVFGLSTALSLARRSRYAQTTITVLDRAEFPSPDGSSIDTSRIIRADYSDPAYAALAAEAQKEWRKQGPGELGGDGRYFESGFVLVAESGDQGEDYVRHSWENVQAMIGAGLVEKGGSKEDRVEDVSDDLGKMALVNKVRKGNRNVTVKDRKVVLLPDPAAIAAVVNTGGSSGDWGYFNPFSGWADATAAMIWLRAQVEATKRVNFRLGQAAQILHHGRRVYGVQLTDGEQLTADLVVVATGAWTGLLVDLRGRATATGQVLAYVQITEQEEARLAHMPVLLNMSSGCFVIPPKNGILKVARHHYGYANPKRIAHPENGKVQGSADSDKNRQAQESVITVSLPHTTFDEPEMEAPEEGQRDCRVALAEMIPWLAGRPFFRTRLCWYTDTPKGDFLIDYHPQFDGLFIATGGSGHGFKFLPVLGDAIVDTVEGNCPPAFRAKWSWPTSTVEKVVTEDGSRGGLPGLILGQEWRQQEERSSEQEHQSNDQTLQQYARKRSKL
jgi:sarcosine oxidase/L-pipecolate oxidase